ncbi:MAG: hypothetical protein Q7K44_05485 [Candidatus Liptonbacteria bacterium]|nr:hypothetical protein [Candidatus Liptonbacteria bacterium]
MNKTRTPLFLMANLGSDMSQLFSYVDKGELKLLESAALRARKIIDELLIHPDMEGRTGEIEILKDIIEDIFAEKRRFAVKKTEIEEYFMPFALRLMSV